LLKHIYHEVEKFLFLKVFRWFISTSGCPWPKATVKPLCENPGPMPVAKSGVEITKGEITARELLESFVPGESTIEVPSIWIVKKCHPPCCRSEEELLLLKKQPWLLLAALAALQIQRWKEKEKEK
jgi:hypothetical protein